MMRLIKKQSMERERDDASGVDLKALLLDVTIYIYAGSASGRLPKN
jgi:hypothetical protein